MNASSDSSEARFHLDVCRGRTRNPSRPIDRETFLVGSAESCHLRLGDDSIPALHSALRVVGEFVELVSIELAPAVHVNGIETTEALLEHGDVIEIGGFEFTLRDESAAEELVSDLSELDAGQLVDQLERDLELVDRVETSRTAGAESLFEAVRERHARSEAEQMARRLEEFTTEIDRRSLQLADREQRFAEAVGQLFEAQRMLEERLALVERVIENGADGNRRAA